LRRLFRGPVVSVGCAWLKSSLLLKIPRLEYPCLFLKPPRATAHSAALLNRVVRAAKAGWHPAPRCLAAFKANKKIIPLLDKHLGEGSDRNAARK